jgi:molecular chaperone GrpE
VAEEIKNAVSGDETMEEQKAADASAGAEDTEVNGTPEDAAAEEEAEDSEVTDDSEAEDGSDSGTSGKKEGFFKKKKKDKKDEQIEELNDRIRRQMAEFDNFRKRTEKEKSQMFDMGARTIIEKILPVVDNFERGFTTVEEADKDDAFVQGMDKVYKQLITELDAMGVKPIECVGQEFNPEYHNAVMQVESEEFESGVVAQELLKGYTYKDTVVRHSMVAVVS